MKTRQQYRTRQVMVRMNDLEFSRLTERAQAMGVHMSEILRNDFAEGCKNA